MDVFMTVFGFWYLSVETRYLVSITNFEGGGVKQECGAPPSHS
jgi:hypothetical protein